MLRERGGGGGGCKGSLNNGVVLVILEVGVVQVGPAECRTPWLVEGPSGAGRNVLRTVGESSFMKERGEIVRKFMQIVNRACGKNWRDEIHPCGQEKTTKRY